MVESRSSENELSRKCYLGKSGTQRGHKQETIEHKVKREGKVKCRATDDLICWT